MLDGKTAFSWACDVDRELKLNLSNGQVEDLAWVIHPEPEQRARALMAKGASEIRRVLGIRRF